ncbi:histidine phosphatase family protein [Acidithrix sp. C25]|uniref:histidine phosphatase family protein n=1 Tax=Acidithrix sp. C25 TaxID=1671482 RepID=UPI00191BC62E|nr:histidine phosphatase family protein [Acidithrix sp. C25]
MEKAKGFIELILIRHGESQSTLDMVVGGHLGCRGLSSFGMTQSLELGEFLSSKFSTISSSRVVASSILRTTQTAQLAIGIDPSVIERLCGLCEIDPGEDDGKAWANLSLVEVKIDSAIGPGGESIVQMYDRVDLCLGELLAEASNALLAAGQDAREGPTFVFTHRGPISSAYAICKGTGVTSLKQYVIETASVHSLLVCRDSIEGARTPRLSSFLGANIQEIYPVHAR